MRRLILLRHAEAAHPSQESDRERPLTKAGRLAAMQVGCVLARKFEHIDLAIASESRRTRETLELALAQYGQTPKTIFDGRIYQAERNDLMAVARELPKDANDVLIVGHNPAIAEFALFLADGGNETDLARLTYGVPPGSLTILDIREPDWSELRWSAAKLNLFLTPAD